MIVVRMIARGVWVTLVVIATGLVWFVGWLGLLLAFRPRAVRQRWFAARFAGLLISLGATFVKVGQIMSTRPDLLPPHVIHALTRLQDDVGAFAWRHVERAIVEDFGVEAGTFRRHAVAVMGLAVAILATKESLTRRQTIRGCSGMGRYHEDDRCRDAANPAHIGSSGRNRGYCAERTPPVKSLPQ